MIQDKIFFDEKDPTGVSYNTPFTVYGSYEGRLWSKTPSGTIKYYTQNSDLSVYATTGSNSFNGNQTVTGSLTVTGGITGSVTTASYVEYASVANKPALVSGSAQVSFNGIVDKPTLVSGSEQITYSGISSIPTGIVSSSAQVGEYGIFATTGSNTFVGSQIITGSIFGSGSLTIDGCITATGQIVAQTINVQQVTSSIVYSCGSNIFGNNLANTQQFTGSVGMTGSLAVAGAGTFASSITANARSFVQGPAGYLFDVQTTDVNQPRLQVYVDDTNGVDLISGYNSTAKSLRFVTGNSSRLTIASTGAACFACELTAKSLGTNDLILNNLNHEHANYVDGTRGSWLIQEGACDLFIINQVSCKKYKFNLIEIN